MEESLEALVRRVDEDRWLSSRFADPAARKRLIGLYAMNYEVARVAEAVSDGMAGAMRLQFWRDAVEAIFAGKEPPAHPAAEALADAVKNADLPREPLDALIDARQCDLEPTPFETWAELEAYIDGASGALMALAAKICAPEMECTPAQTAAIRAAGRAWGYAGLVRALPYWTAQRRTFFPRRLRDHVKLDEALLFSGLAADHAASAAARAVLDRANGAYGDVRRLAPALPKEVFPAVGYISLAPGYIRAASKTNDAARVPAKPPALFARQLRLVGAAATGSL